MADDLSDDAIHPVLTRLERVVARIERASAARIEASRSMTRRHALLRQRMTEALAALDAVIARQESLEREDA